MAVPVMEVAPVMVPEMPVSAVAVTAVPASTTDLLHERFRSCCGVCALGARQGRGGSESGRQRRARDNSRADGECSDAHVSSSSVRPGISIICPVNAIDAAEFPFVRYVSRFELIQKKAPCRLLRRAI